MRINSIFPAIQGEGNRIGTPEVFVRFQGCSVRCKWCDTPEALKFDEGKEKTVGEILSEIRKFKIKNANLTGGEPLDQDPKELLELIKALKNKDFFVTLETSGQKFNQKIMSCVDFISADIKPPSSGIRPNFKVLEKINKFKEKQFKIVVASNADFAFAKRVSKTFSNVVVTPLWSMNAVFNKKLVQNLVFKVIDLHADLRIIVQQHKLIFGHKKGV